jgi:DNA primase
VATTNSEGATKGKWAAALNKWFAGRKTVYVLEDNDETGRGHVAEVADNLREIVQDIKIVEFRDLAEHGDDSEWLADHTKEELLARAIYGRIPEYRFRLLAFAELNTVPAFVKDLIPRSGLTVVWDRRSAARASLFTIS